MRHPHVQGSSEVQQAPRRDHRRRRRGGADRGDRRRHRPRRGDVQEQHRDRPDPGVGQGGPNFVQNAVLGPLEDKRIATVNRIATAIGRTADKPQGLEALAPCALDADGAADTGEEAGEEAGAGEEAEATPSATASEAAGEDTGETGDTGDAAAAGAITCPDVASQLPAIPATAQAEVVGQGGPNFVQNAVLGPLEDKRIATVNRIATAIGRTADKPQGLDSLAACTLTQ